MRLELDSVLPSSATLALMRTSAKAKQSCHYQRAAIEHSLKGCRVAQTYEQSVPQTVAHSLRSITSNIECSRCII